MKTKSLIMFVSFVLTAIVLTPLVSAEELPSGIKAKIDLFFQQVQKGELQPALEKITEGGMVGNNEAQLKNLVAQIMNAVNLYGTITSYEYVQSSMVGESLCQAVFLSKNVQYPLRWTFIFYKSTTDWILINIEFDDNIEELF